MEKTDWSSPRFRGQLTGNRFEPGLRTPFEGNWWLVAKGRMAAAGIVPALNELEDRHTRLSLAAEHVNETEVS